MAITGHNVPVENTILADTVFNRRMRPLEHFPPGHDIEQIARRRADDQMKICENENMVTMK